MRHAVVIGLGEKTGTALECIRQQYTALSSTDDLTCLQVTSTATNDPTCLSLKMDNHGLRKLYYEENVRHWSGPNWKEWGKSLSSNRLFGKLSAFYYRREMYDWLNAHVRVNAHYYVIAPLHDPFASGLLFDIAYMLHKLALERSARVFGLFFLPGLDDDPVIETDNDEYDRELRRAISYASLRELQFATDQWSFYNTYSDELGHLNTKNTSPFQTGDYYLFGGERDGSAKEVTDWSFIKISQMLSEFIYFQCFAPANFMPVSPKYRRGFTAFGLRNQATTTTAEQQNDTQTLFHLQTLLRHLVNNANVKFADIAVNFSAQFVEEAERDITERAGVYRGIITENTAALKASPIEAAEGGYVDQVEHLRTYENMLAAKSENALNEIRKSLNERVSAVATRLGVTLSYMQTWVKDSIQMLDDYYQRNQERVKWTEQRATDTARNMRQARAEVEYNDNNERLTPRLLMAALLLLLPTAYASITIGILRIPMVMLVALPLTIRAAWEYRRRQRQTTLTNFQSLQNELIRLQTELVRLRAVSAYWYNLRLEWKSVESDLDKLHAILLREQAQIELKLRGDSTNNSGTMDIRSAATDVFKQLWQERDKIIKTPDSVVTLLKHFITSSPLYNESMQTPEAIGERVNAQFDLVEIGIALSPAILKDTQNVRHLICVANWSDKAMRALRSYDYKARSTEVINLTPQQELEPASIAAMKRPLQDQTCLLTFEVRLDVPLTSLLNLDYWHAAYYNACQVADGERKLTYRSHLHPTRMGIASPDILRSPAAAARDFPPIVMIIVVMLRLFNKREIIEQLCEQLGVISTPEVNYDELCGALQETPSLVDHITSLVERDAQDFQPGSANLIEKARESLQKRRVHMKESETYADWEIWAESLLLRELRTPTDERRTRLLARLQNYFTQDLPLPI